MQTHFGHAKQSRLHAQTQTMFVCNWRGHIFEGFGNVPVSKPKDLVLKDAYEKKCWKQLTPDFIFTVLRYDLFFSRDFVTFLTLKNLFQGER